MSYRDSSPSFFKQLSKSMPPLGLTTVELAHVETCYRYLDLYLRNCWNTLRALRLAHMTFTKPGDHDRILHLISDAFYLTSRVLTNINVAGNGVNFSTFHKKYPECWAQNHIKWGVGRTFVCRPAQELQAQELRASGAEEAMKEYLRYAAMECTLGPAWKDWWAE